jgi:hypothetical protein
MKKYFSLKNLMELMTMMILIPAFYWPIYSTVTMILLACLAIFFSFLVKELITIKYTLLVGGITTLCILPFNNGDIAMNYIPYSIILAIILLIYGIYKSANKLDKINFIIEIIMIFSIFHWQFAFFETLMSTVIRFSLPFVFFFTLYAIFFIHSSNETSDKNTKKSCYAAFVGAIINVSLFLIYIVFAITFPDYDTDYFCKSILPKFFPIFILAGLAMGSYYFCLGQRSKWKLSNIFICSIIGLFGLGVVNAIIAGCINENFVGLQMYILIPSIYYISMALIVYSNIKFIKLL